MNLNDEVQRDRLFRAIEASYRELEPFRNLVRGLVDEYVCPGYGAQNKPRREMLVSLMNQAVQAYTMTLAANRPRVLVSTPVDELKYFAQHFQLAMNGLIKEIGLEQTIRKAVKDAFFCVGIVKVHMGDSAPVMLETDLWMDPGQPFASNVSLDNWVHDMGATEFTQVSFAGDMYRVPFEDLKSDLYEQSVVKQLSPTTKWRFDEEERLDRISRGVELDKDEFLPSIDLLDVWVPRERKIFTFALAHGRKFVGKHAPLAVMDSVRPKMGPYRWLSFDDVPENIMPSSPASHLAGLHRLINNLTRKSSQQARGQKDVYTYTPAGADAAKNIERSSGNQWVEVHDKNDVGVMKIGGVDPTTQAFTLGMIQIFDRMAGNLSAQLGLGSQAPTLGQEQLIYGQVSKTEAFLQSRTIDFCNGLIMDLAELLWSDKAKVVPGELPIEGTPYSVDATWYPWDREGDLDDYDLQVDVYSMVYQSPSQRVQAINQLLKEIYIPLAPILAQQGGVIDLRKLAEIHAELLNEPRLKDVLQFAQPMTGGETSGPGNTSREYIRRSVPTAGTQQGRQHVQEQSWIDMAGQNTPQETAAMQ